MSKDPLGLDDVRSGLRSWLEALRIALAARTASLWTLTGEGQLVVELASPPDADVTPSQVSLHGHALGWVVSEGIALRASRDDIFHFHRPSGGWIVAAPVTEPMGDRVGCVSLEFDGIPRPDAPLALELAADIAGQIIGRVRATEEARADNERSQALYRAVQDLTRGLDLERLAAEICQRALEITGARGSVVAAWDSIKAVGQVVATHGETPRGLGGADVVGGSSFLGLALSNKVELPRDDLRGKGKFPLYGAGFDSKAGSAIISPMTLGDEPVGAIAVEYAKPRQFGERDLERLRTLSAFVAPSFRNALEFGEVQELSLTDSLTGLPNRRNTERVLASAVALAERTGSHFAVAVADIDHFKKFNDQYGHDAGDVVLQGVAHVIRDELRPSDHVGRWGGEEFLIVLASTGLEDAARVIDRIRRSIEGSEIRLGGRTLNVTLSAGVSAFPEVVKNPGTVVVSADKALYKAKRAGRNAVALADPRGR